MNKFKSHNPIKEIKARNEMRKSPANKYFERMKLAAAEVNVRVPDKFVL